MLSYSDNRIIEVICWKAVSVHHYPNIIERRQTLGSPLFYDFFYLFNQG